MFNLEGSIPNKYGNQRSISPETMDQVQLERAIRDFLYPAHDQLVAHVNDLPAAAFHTPSLFVSPRARILGLKEVCLDDSNSQIEAGKVLVETQNKEVVGIDTLEAIIRGVRINAKFDRKACALLRKFMIRNVDPESSIWLRMTESLSLQFGSKFDEVYVDTKVPALGMKSGEQKYYYAYHPQLNRFHGGKTQKDMSNVVPSQLSTTEYLNIVSDLVLNCPAVFDLD